MKIYLIIFGTLFSFNKSIFAHTGFPDTVHCPICVNNVVFYVTTSMTTFGGYLDFQKKGAIGYYYQAIIGSCNYCCFSGYHSDFDTTYSNSIIDSVRKVRLNLHGIKIKIQLVF